MTIDHPDALPDENSDEDPTFSADFSHTGLIWLVTWVVI
jgi:hypothetical protein